MRPSTGRFQPAAPRGARAAARERAEQALGVDRVRGRAKIERERLRLARDRAGHGEPLAGDRERAFVDPDGVAGDVEAHALDRDRDVPAFEDVDPVAFEAAGGARPPRVGEIDRRAEVAPQRAFSRGRLRKHPRERAVVEPALERELRVEAAHFSDAVASVSGSFTARRRRSRCPGCAVRSKSARTSPARPIAPCATSGAAAPPARCRRPDESVSGARGIALAGSRKRVRAQSRLRSPARPSASVRSKRGSGAA